MKKTEIKVGGIYTVKVSGKVVPVRVDAIRKVESYRSSGYQRRRDAYWNDFKRHYDVTNLSTGRKMTFKSAARFRKEVTENPTRAGATNPASEAAAIATGVISQESGSYTAQSQPSLMIEAELEIWNDDRWDV